MSQAESWCRTKSQIIPLTISQRTSTLEGKYATCISPKKYESQMAQIWNHRVRKLKSLEEYNNMGYRYHGTDIDGHTIDPAQLYVRNKNLNDLIGHFSFTGAIYHLLTGSVATVTSEEIRK